MATYTLAEVTTFYEAAKSQYLKALNSDEYTIKDRELKRQKLDSLRNEMDRWKTKMDQLTAGQNSKKRVSLHVPIDV